MDGNLSRRLLIKSTVCTPLLQYLVPQLAWGRQDTDGAIDFPSQWVLARADAAFSSRRRVADSLGERIDWLHEGLSPVSEINPDLTLVAEDIRPSSTFDLSRIAKRGDLVRIRWRHQGRELTTTLVYIGEQSFPDESAQRSFFVFPHRGRLEYNTLPIRRHAESDAIFRFDDIAPVDPHVEAIIGMYAEPDPQRMNRQWAVGSNAFDTNSSMVNGTARLTIFRLRRIPEGSTGQLALKVPHAEIREGEQLKGIVASNGPVGMESDLRRQSWRQTGRGERTVDLGPVDQPGVYFVHAFDDNSHVINYVVAMPSRSGRLEVEGISLPTDAFEDMKLTSLRRRFLELLRENDFDYFVRGMERAALEFAAVNALGVAVIFLAGPLSIAGICGAGSMIVDFFAAAGREAATLMAQDGKLYEDDAALVATWIRQWATLGSFAFSLFSGLNGMSQWATTTKAGKLGEIVSATATSSTIVNEFVVEREGEAGPIVSKVLTNQTQVLLQISDLPGLRR